MLKFIVGVIVGAGLLALGVYVYFVTGIVPVATAAGAMPFERTLAKKALKAHVEEEMPKNVPIQATEQNLAAGVPIYVEHCAVCHGLPNQPQTAIAKGEFPKPPQLFHGKGVTDDPPGETYWKVANGIRLTGMPAFKNSLSDEQMWQVSLLLATEKLPESVKQTLDSASVPQAAPR